LSVGACEVVTASLESGKRFADRYVLHERLGDGGHAEVWAAQDEHAQQRVALKFLHLQSCGAEDAWRVLQHEAQMVRRLDHPGVLRVDSPERDGDSVFLPMEYASGGDVRALRGAPWRQVLPVLLQVAAVLEHAHSRGVVHRDIKPGNVLFDAQGQVRVTDFGTAARMGSTTALADGSPFSASPQQLRGEAAATADDVYGLGALAYELLSRYPPYYPDFDARRVQQEMPAPLLPVHPAPPGLLAFVMAMLEREPQRRPDLGDVSEYFSQLLNAPATHSGAGVLVDEPVPQPPVSAPRRRPRALWWLAAAALAALALFVWLPARMMSPPTGPAIAAPSAGGAKLPSAAQSSNAVAEARPQPQPQVGAAPDPITQDLAAGEAALRANQPALARAAFQRALLHAADSEAARAGVAASEVLQRSLDQYSIAMRAEASGDLEGARAQYLAILRDNRRFAPAQAALTRVHAAEEAQKLEAALQQGAQALAAGRVALAEQAYARAASIRADEPRVRDGQARIAEIRRSERNQRDLASGVDFERQERWDEAVAHYRAVLDRDAQLRFADDGLTRSTRRAELDHELRDYLDRPERLTASAVRLAAERALARGEATSPQGARLTAQLQQLRARMALLDTPAHVQILSDNSTQVSVPAVGELGIFMQRELDLPPGQYTVIGRREGFRDVRRELNISPGQQRVALTVECTERI
jgi:hypothetical protein